MGRMQELTVWTQEVVEKLEEREAVPALGWLDLQGGVHVHSVEGQEVLCMFHHQVRPPREGLKIQQEERGTEVKGGGGV